MFFAPMLLLTTVITVTANRTRGTLTLHHVGLLPHKTGEISVADIFVFEIVTVAKCNKKNSMPRLLKNRPVSAWNWA